jgi:hypothetical protein
VRPVHGRTWNSRRCAPTVMGHESRPLTCIAAVTASGSAMTVSATTLRVQEFDKGRGPVGLPPIGQACDLPAWPDQGPCEGSLVKFWGGHQPDADAHRERGHSARRAWRVTPLTRPPGSGPWTAGSKGANRGGIGGFGGLTQAFLAGDRSDLLRGGTRAARGSQAYLGPRALAAPGDKMIDWASSRRRGDAAAQSIQAVRLALRGRTGSG